MRNSNNETRRGAGMTEYIIIVGLIAVAAIAPVKALAWRLEDSLIMGSIVVSEVGDPLDPEADSSSR